MLKGYTVPLSLAPVRTGAGFCFTLSYSVTDLRTLT